MANFAFFSYDWGPYVNLQAPVMQALGAMGHSFLVITRMHTNPQVLMAHQPDMVIISIASFDRKSDASILQTTAQMGTPCFVVSETHHTWSTPGVENLIRHCHAIVASPDEVTEAEQFGYATASYVACPPAWQHYPNIVPAAVERSSSDEYLIFMTGNKSPEDTDLVLGWCADALRSASFKYKIVISTHPAEDQSAMNQNRREGILARFRAHEIHMGNGDAYQAACDLAISPAACSTAVVAAFRRQPVICPMDEHFRRINAEKQFGRPYFYPADPRVGACILSNPNKLSEDIKRMLLDKTSRDELYMRQKAAYPILDTKEPSERAIARFLINQISQPPAK